MNITKVYLTKLQDSKTLALASITINGEIAITGLRVLNGKTGLWVAMPSRKDKDGGYKDIAYPVTKEARQQIIDTVLEKYNEEPREDVVRNYADDFKKREESKLDVTEDDLPF